MLRRWHAADRTRFALYWEDESGARAALTYLGSRSSGPIGCRTRSPRWASKRGDSVALMLPQRPETAIAHIAVYQMGAIAVPLSFLFGPDALEYRLDDSEAQRRDRRPAIAAESRADPREASEPSRT